VNAKISFSELHCLCMDVDNQLHKQIIYSRNQFTFLETNLVHEDSAYIIVHTQIHSSIKFLIFVSSEIKARLVYVLKSLSFQTHLPNKTLFRKQNTKYLSKTQNTTHVLENFPHLLIGIF